MGSREVQDIPVGGLSATDKTQARVQSARRPVGQDRVRDEQREEQGVVRPEKRDQRGSKNFPRPIATERADAQRVLGQPGGPG